MSFARIRSGHFFCDPSAMVSAPLVSVFWRISGRKARNTRAITKGSRTDWYCLPVLRILIVFSFKVEEIPFISSYKLVPFPDLSAKHILILPSRMMLAYIAVFYPLIPGIRVLGDIGKRTCSIPPSPVSKVPEIWACVFLPETYLALFNVRRANQVQSTCPVCIWRV